MSNQISFENRESAFEKRIQTFAIVNKEHIDIEFFLEDAFYYFNQQLSENLQINHMVKVFTSFKCVFEKTIINSEDVDKLEKQTIYSNSKTKIVNSETNLRDFYNKYIIPDILINIEEVIMKGSGFKLSEINELLVQLNKYEPLSGSSYIDLPAHLKNKKAIINVKNNDDKCFKYAVLSALFPVDVHAERLSNYVQHFKKLNFIGINFPVEINQISKFENLNPAISINVYIYNHESQKIETLRVTNIVKTNHIHLLLISKDNRLHYCWIKNLSRLLSLQSSKNEHQFFFCDRCLNYFMKKERLEKHSIDCAIQNKYVIEMPTSENCIIKFEHYENQLVVPFIIYADIETYLGEPEDKFSESENMIAYQQHKPYSVAFYFKSMYDEFKSYYKSRRGRDCIQWFVKELETIAGDIFKILNKNKKKMQTTSQYEEKSECHICSEKFNKDDIIVRDHSHLNGQYRGLAHQSCNLKYQETRHIPIVFHNLSYDLHFLISDIATDLEGKVDIIPLNNQQYISFTKTMEIDTEEKIDFREKIRFRFIDSFRFMASSLDQLSSLLPSEKKNILHQESRKCGFSYNQIKMLEQKGVFPYDYITSIKVLKENMLPPQNMFYNKLTESNISDEKYKFAKEIWKKFNIRNLGEYSDLYLKTDVLLLADVFENFRYNCYQNYRLDSAHYFTIASFTWDAMLKKTNVKIDLLTDVDMLMFIEKGMLLL